MIRTSTHFVPPTHEYFKECDELCLISKNLYNSCLYYIRQHYFETDKLFEEVDGRKYYLFDNNHLYHKFKETPEFRTSSHPDYNGRNVNTKVMKQVYINVKQNFSGFYGAIKSYRKNPSKFTARPKIPNYKKSRFVCTFPKEAISFVKVPGFAKLASANIAIPLGELTKDMVEEIKICPLVYGYNVIISYDDGYTLELPTRSEITRIAAIDIGLNNLATLTSNDPSFTPVIINGRPLKSINQFYNKYLAKYNSELPKGTFTSTKIKRFTNKRNHKIKDYLHKSSKMIIDMLVRRGIECLVVGSNKQWKTEISLGKRNNQNFVGVPFYKFKQMLKYKCEMNGIMYIEREESYTSKCSFLDMELIQKQDTYVGTRIRRGLFNSSSGIHINADVNGSFNILRKEFGSEVFTFVESYCIVPFKLNA